MLRVVCPKCGKLISEKKRLWFLPNKTVYEWCSSCVAERRVRENSFKKLISINTERPHKY